MPDAELRRGAVGYTIEFARVLRTSSPAAAFSFLSGSGADRQDEAGWLSPAQGRGRKSAAWVPSLHLPARVHLSRRGAERTEFQLPRVAHNLPASRMLFPNQVIRADDLARSMVDVAVRKRGF